MSFKTKAVLLLSFLGSVFLFGAPWSSNSLFKQTEPSGRNEALKKNLVSRGIVYTGENLPLRWSFAFYGRKQQQTIAVRFQPGKLDIDTGKNALTLHNQRQLSLATFKKLSGQRFFAAGTGKLFIQCGFTLYDKNGQYLGSARAGHLRLNAKTPRAEVKVNVAELKFPAGTAKLIASFDLTGQGTVTELGISAAEKLSVNRQVFPEKPIYTGPAHKRLFPEILLTCQGQCYAITEREHGYLNRWNDQPLLLDTSLAWGGRNKSTWTQEQFDRSIKEMLDYGFDGFTNFPETYNRLGTMALAAKSKVPGAKVFPVIGYYFYPYSEKEVMPLVMKTSGFKYKGSPVIFAYKTAKSNRTPAELAKKLARLRKTYGHFLVMCDLDFLTRLQNPYNAGSAPSPQMLDEFREQIRSWLRVADGIYFGELHMLIKAEGEERNFNTKFYKNCIIPLMKSVLNEPEFKGRKFFGLCAINGHENNYQWGYYVSHNGTRTLRESFLAALAANPDYINFAEWDEWNENTSIAPTFRSAYATKRILRYLFAGAKNKKYTALPQDDLSIPNLIISCRSTLALGEKLRFEVLNVPDPGISGKTTFELTLKSIDGKILHRFPKKSLDQSKLADIELTYPTEKLAGERAVLLSLKTHYKGKTQVWEEGLPFVELRPANNWQYRWNKIPLRDLLKLDKAELKLTERTADGRQKFKVTFSGKEKIAYAVTLADNDAVQVYDPSGFEEYWREGDDNLLFGISFASPRDIRTNGTIKASGVREPEWRHVTSVKKGAEYPLVRISDFCRNTLLRVKRTDMKDARLEFNSPQFKAVVPLDTVMKKGIYSVTGEYGRNVTVRRLAYQSYYPRTRLNKTAASYESSVLLHSPQTILHTFIVSTSGRVYRTRPVCTAAEKGKTAGTVVLSITQKKAVKLTLPACQLPRLEYDFSPVAGSLLSNRANDCRRYGILGAPASLVTFLNRGAGLYGYPFRFERSLRDVRHTAPARLQEEGKYFLRFTPGSCVVFPQGVLPRTSGYNIELEIRPQKIAGRQVFFSHRHGGSTPGSLWLTITPDGKLRGDFAGLSYVHTGIETNLKITPGKWNNVKVFHRVDSIEFEVNGKKSGRYSCVSPGRYETALMLGGFPGQWFHGDLRKLVIDCRL
ncbi:MAG: hypothetical protein IKC65_07885 [Lentisphaeria bacterium]|nr:hypothetical protein [Lentisphaeria bacterium]